VSNRGRNVIAAELATLVDDLQRHPPPTDRGLSELVDTAARNVPGAQYCGITLAGRDEVTTAASTHRFPELLDEIQQIHRQGPCLDAAWEHHTVHISDLAGEQRWPDYRRDAIEKTPIRSVLSFELFVNNGTLAALNFYSETPRVFTDESSELGLIFAAHTALAWRILLRDEQFRSALASRDIIGQAKGIIMERFGVDAVQAFNLLTRLSQESNTKLIEVAQRLVDSDHPTTSTEVL
jgi:GAF domain-containing protein